MHGLESEEEILEEEANGDPEIAAEIYNERIENWIDYTCFPWSKEEEKIAKRKGHYNNRYSDITSKKSKNVESD